MADPERERESEREREREREAMQHEGTHIRWTLAPSTFNRLDGRDLED